MFYLSTCVNNIIPVLQTWSMTEVKLPVVCVFTVVC